MGNDGGMAPDPRLDDQSLAREAQAATASLLSEDVRAQHELRLQQLRSRPQVDHFGATAVPRSGADLLGSLVGALSGGLVAFLAAFLLVHSSSALAVIVGVGAIFGALTETLFVSGAMGEVAGHAHSDELQDWNAQGWDGPGSRSSSKATASA
jgi:hypothetical protein